VKEFCRIQLPVHAGVQVPLENSGVTMLALRRALRRLNWAVILTCLLSRVPLLGQDTDPPTDQTSQNSSWSFHVQATAVPQGHGGFDSPYRGPNSLLPYGELETSFTSTFYVGHKLWDGAELYFNPEVLAGKGLSSTLGLAGFPNGEIYRVSDPQPRVTVARLFIRQSWNLGGPEDPVNDSPNQLPGRSRSRRISFSVGKFSLVDMFDGNAYSHDARTQFLNWSIMDNGAWDFAADTQGYTEGFAVEGVVARWSLRYANVLMPKHANGMAMDLRIGRAHSDNLELEHRHILDGHKGALRLVAYVNHAHMGNYRTTLETPAYGMDITKSRTYSRKYGLGINAEQEIARGIGVFFRGGWNDGHTETFVYTEIDRTASGGLSANGAPWGRKHDTLGIAFVANGISKDHREYLQAGGEGFLIGDGKLNYGKEEIVEAYYSVALGKGVLVSPDFQFVTHPAYNRDRGPVPIYAVRFHWER
jgi:high affinity Mn2+ porin